MVNGYFMLKIVNGYIMVKMQHDIYDSKCMYVYILQAFNACTAINGYPLPRKIILAIVRANLTRVTSPPRRFPSYLLIYFLFIFYLSRCTLPDFPSVSSLASQPFLSCFSSINNNILSSQNNWSDNQLRFSLFQNKREIVNTIMLCFK